MKINYKLIALVILGLFFDQVLQRFINGPLYEPLIGLWKDENFPRIVGAIGEILVFGGLYYLFIQRDKPINLEKIKKINPLWILIIGMGASGITALWFGIADIIIPPNEAIETVDDFNEALDLTGGSSFIPSLVFAGILGPIAEEFIFRGLAFKGLKKAGLGSALAIAISALAFGIWHGNPIQIVYASLVGAIFAYIFDRTNSLGLVILIHIVNNSLSSIVGELTSENIQTTYTYLCILAVPFLIYKLIKMKKVEESNENFTNTLRDNNTYSL